MKLRKSNRIKRKYFCDCGYASHNKEQWSDIHEFMMDAGYISFTSNGTNEDHTYCRKCGCTMWFYTTEDGSLKQWIDANEDYIAQRRRKNAVWGSQIFEEAFEEQ